MPDWLPYEYCDDADDLTGRLAEGEHEFQDFKQTISDYLKIARSVVAFANHQGGSLFVGVDDKGRVIGTTARSEYYRLADLLEQYCRPLPDVHTYVYDMDGMEVLEIAVEAGRNKPYASLDKSGKWSVYVREGDRCVRVGTPQP